jgi:hypothetical protein
MERKIIRPNVKSVIYIVTFNVLTEVGMKSSNFWHVMPEVSKRLLNLLKPSGNFTYHQV